MKEVQDHHKIIETLRDDNEYYTGVGRNYLSNSDIGKLLGNPKEFRVPQDDNINFAKGRYFHQMILEPEKAKNVVHVDASTRSTKLYKNFLEENELPFCMLTKEKEGIEAGWTIKCLVPCLQQRFSGGYSCGSGPWRLW